MQLSDMVAAINRNVDDVVAQTDAIAWLNEGKSKMEQATSSAFPDIDGSTVLTYPFPETYHNLPVLYASAMYQQANLMRQQYVDLMQEFNDGLQYFVERYDIPPQYWANPQCQQFTGVSGQLAYVITSNSYDPDSADLRLFINNVETWDFQLPTNPATNPSTVVTTSVTTNAPKGFMFNTTTTINNGDNITASWELHADMIEAPYPWWNRW